MRRKGADRPAVLEVLQRIWALDHGLQVRSKDMTRRLGVTGPQRLVLAWVTEGRATEPGELAKQLCVHRSTMTGIVARLERAGLMRRTRDKGDLRRFRLSVTAAGRRLARPHPVTIESAVTSTLRDLTPAQVAAGCLLLASLAEHLVAGDTASRSKRRARPTRRNPIA